MHVIGAFLWHLTSMTSFQCRGWMESLLSSWSKGNTVKKSSISVLKEMVSRWRPVKLIMTGKVGPEISHNRPSISAESVRREYVGS